MKGFGLGWREIEQTTYEELNIMTAYLDLEEEANQIYMNEVKKDK